MLMFSSRSGFKILSEQLPILDSINNIHHCIRLDFKKNIVNFSFLYIFYFSRIWKFAC